MSPIEAAARAIEHLDDPTQPRQSTYEDIARAAVTAFLETPEFRRVLWTYAYDGLGGQDAATDNMLAALKELAKP